MIDALEPRESDFRLSTSHKDYMRLRQGDCDLYQGTNSSRAAVAGQENGFSR